MPDLSSKQVCGSAGMSCLKLQPVSPHENAQWAPAPALSAARHMSAVCLQGGCCERSRVQWLREVSGFLVVHTTSS